MRLSLKPLLAGLVLCLGLVVLAVVTGHVHPQVPDVVASLWHGFTTNLSAVGSGIALAAPPLVTKNPKALALRAEADAKETELFDVAKRYTKDEVEKRAEEIRDLRQRAQLAGSFTPQDEVDRQAGDLDPDDPANRTAGAIGGDPTKSPLKHRTGQQKSDALRVRAQEEFGSVGKMVMALAQHRGNLSDGQAAVLKDLATLTRTIVGTTSDPSGGEFLLPLQQEASIFRVPNAQMGILPYARKYSVKGRTLRIPYLVQDTATGASGVVTYPISGGIADIQIIGEAVTKPTAQPSFAQRLLTAYKYAAYTEFGDEVLDDDFTGELPTSVIDIIGQQVLNNMDDHMTFSGTGTAMPLGALNAANGSLLAVARTTGGTLTVDDVFNLYARHTFGPNSYWSMSRYLIANLMKLTLGSNTLVTWLPNLRDGVRGGDGTVPYLLGLPVRMNDFQPALGTQGDFALINPDFYAAGIRTQLTVDVSTHYQFRNDVTAYRFVARAGGLPLPTGTYAYRATGTTKTVGMVHSPFVCVAT